MGHLVFIILHLVAITFGMVFLWLTIPLHIIYGAVSNRTVVQAAPDGSAPTPETHVRCPDCAELVLKQAKVCKHCHCKLVPQLEGAA